MIETIAVLLLGCSALLLLVWNLCLLSENRDLRQELSKQREWNYRDFKKNSQERI